MPRILYHAYHFGRHWGPNLQGSHSLNISWFDIVWAAITVGKLGYQDIFAHSQFSVNELRFRTHLLYANLMNDGGEIRRSSLYDSLDSTEKSAISYFLGMMIAKLMGLFLLNTPWLVHIEKLNRIYDLGLVGRSRPDLLGKDRRGNWVVVEAKGRTNGFSQQALDNAKSQTRKLRHISGMLPNLRVATEACFDNGLQVHISDPENYDEYAIDIEIKEEKFLFAYYEPFRDLYDLSLRSETIKDEYYLFSDYEVIGLSIGLSKRLYEYTSKPDIKVKNIGALLHKEPIEIPEEKRRTVLYPDGIAISLDSKWSEDMMSLRPEKRK